MNSNNFVPLVIWFAIFAGVFIILEFAGGGIASLNAPFQIRSFPLLLLGFLPLLVATISRLMVLPKVKSLEGFMPVFIISLALCEGVGIMAMFVFPTEFVTEKAFAIIGTLMGLLVLCPLGLSQLKAQ